MDKCTREVRKQYWKNIITQCLQRPDGMTAKQWLDDNGICEQTYYHWLKRIRQETYDLVTTHNTEPSILPVKNEVSFAEIPVPISATPKSFQPDISINTGSVMIEISNTASAELISHVLEAVGYAR